MYSARAASTCGPKRGVLPACMSARSLARSSGGEGLMVATSNSAGAAPAEFGVGAAEFGAGATALCAGAAEFGAGAAELRPSAFCAGAAEAGVCAASVWQRKMATAKQSRERRNDFTGTLSCDGNLRRL